MLIFFCKYNYLAIVCAKILLMIEEVFDSIVIIIVIYRPDGALKLIDYSISINITLLTEFFSALEGRYMYRNARLFFQLAP